MVIRADEEAKDDFYELFQKAMDGVLRNDMAIVMGDWNAKVGGKKEGENGIVGGRVLRGERNDNGERFVTFCATNSLFITSTMYPHKDIHKHSWTSPDGRYRSQIDHTAVNATFRKSVSDSRVYQGVDIASDHNLTVNVTQVRLCRPGKKKAVLKKYMVVKGKLLSKG